MDDYLLDDVADDVLSRELPEYSAIEVKATVAVLARIAAYDARKLYVPAGYPSMFAYCLEMLHLSEDEAYKRIQAARVARRFPALFDALRHNRLHMTAVRLLAPHVTSDNVAELITAASGRSKAALEQWLAERFPQPEMLPVVSSTISPVPQHAPSSDPLRARTTQLAPGQVGAVRVLPDMKPPPARVTPVSAETYDLHARVPMRARDNLRLAQDLLGHALPSGDIGEILDRALVVYVAQLKKRKFGADAKSRRARKSVRRRCIPAHVRHAVLKRDGGQCTFVGTTGNRCQARKRIEFDHVVPVARGGQATVENMRLRCQTHNQYEAERRFGKAFMDGKRRAAGRMPAGP